MKAWLRPDNVERRYKRFIIKQLKDLRKEILFQFSIVRINRKDAEDDNSKTEEAIAAILLWWSIRKREIELYVNDVFRNVSSFNDQQFRLVVRSLSGITLPSAQSIGYSLGGLYSSSEDIRKVFGDDADVFRTEEYLPSVNYNWTSVQNTYFDSAVQKAILDVKIIVLNAIAIDTTFKLSKELIDTKLNTVENRAILFVENQTSKLDTKLQSVREKSINAKTYEWDTRKDERVRGRPDGLYPKAKPSHWARQGLIYSWSEPPEGGHPGEAEGCRCRAIMRLPR